MSLNPHKPLPAFDAPEPIMRTAGAWLARRDRGFTASEQTEFDAWSAADARHAAAVAQLERTMTAFDGLQALAPDLAQEPDPDAFAPPRPARRWFYPSLAAAGLAAAIALAVWIPSRSAAPTSWHYATAPAGYERNTLPDGSTLELNGDTVVDVDYTAGQRTVRLTRGEAHFQVAKNPARPFVVSAQGVAFRAVGTAFDVRLTSAHVEMLVTEGKVQVEASSAPATPVARPSLPLPLLIAGQRIVVPAAPAEVPVVAALSPAEIDRTLAWQPRIAEFTKTPLSEVVAEFNRRNRRQIVIADAELASLRLGGNFRIDQPEAFVRLLETSFGVASESSGDTISLRKAQ
jgi:transmembrane sensor